MQNIDSDITIVHKICDNVCKMQIQKKMNWFKQLTMPCPESRQGY